MPSTHDDDRRAVSEAIGVATLVFLTVVVTASVGIGVLFLDAGGDGDIDAEFDFQHLEDSGVLIVTYSEGPELEAGNLTVDAPARNATWAALGGLNETDSIASGSSVQLSRQSAYGDSVASNAVVALRYRTAENETVLDAWNRETPTPSALG